MLRLDKDFYSRKADVVARELLGKIIIRDLKDKKIENKQLKAKIAETEAYFDEKDPASRACKNGNLRETMQDEAGTILVYGVHRQWLFNIVTGKKGEASAVLLRAIEPLNFQAKTSGPGLLTKALWTNKIMHGKSIINNESIKIVSSNNKNNKNSFEIQEAKRIGVRKDLARNLRFYVQGNKFVSRK